MSKKKAKNEEQAIELVTNCDQLANSVEKREVFSNATAKHEVKNSQIESMIMQIRGAQVMLDRDLALLYGIETKALNQAVKRNRERFPEDFMFQLTMEECSRSQIVTLNGKRGQNIKYLPYVFTENGIAMLSSVLHSPQAIEVNIHIMRTFTILRRYFTTNNRSERPFDMIERHQLELSIHQMEIDRKIENLFHQLDYGKFIPNQGVFYQGQVFDAYSFVSDLIKSAKNHITLIDNYIDESVLLTLAKRAVQVTAKIITKSVSATLELDLNKHNQQYQPIEVEQSVSYHDRFLIIDNTVYHLGASLKDLGKKLFAFSKLNIPVESLLVTNVHVLDKGGNVNDSSC